MLLKIKKGKPRQVIIKFGKATVIIAASMKCGLWSQFGMILEETWRWSEDVIEDNFFKWFYCEGNQRNVAGGRGSEIKGEFLTLFLKLEM